MIRLIDCWDIQPNEEIQSFQNWGRLFTIDFDITVTKPTYGLWGWTNAFHFTANGNMENYGDRIPALYINSDGYFSICSAINGNLNYWENFDFELGKQYQITIKQFIDKGIYWYEIIIDGESRFKIENTQPQSFSSVKLYASDPWYNSFSSDFGSICNFKIQYLEG